jgi:hypothetical protein
VNQINCSINLFHSFTVPRSGGRLVLYTSTVARNKKTKKIDDDNDYGGDGYAAVAASDDDNDDNNGSVGMATGYGLHNREIGVRFTAEARNFSLLHSVQTSSGAHRTSYTMGIGVRFSRGNAAGA